MAIETIALIILGAWLLVVSVFVFLNLYFFKKLEKDTGQTSLKKVIEKIVAGEAKNHSEIEELFRKNKLLEEDAQLHVQKVGLIRFNPFREMGGDHSFSLALLDGRDTGVIVTGLHTRDRTRVYMKAIRGGKCEFELSDEEKKALTKAQKG
jgi:hypothetical protein